MQAVKCQIPLARGQGIQPADAIGFVQVRARTFYAEAKGINVADVEVPVVGGHAGVTILPLFSQATPHKDLSHEEAIALTKRTQEGGTEGVQAKSGKVGVIRLMSMQVLGSSVRVELIKCAQQGGSRVVQAKADNCGRTSLLGLFPSPNKVHDGML